MKINNDNDVSIPAPLVTGGESNSINVSGIQITWDPDSGVCRFRDIPVAMMWIDTTLAGLMSGVAAMVGPERFSLALQAEGRNSVESDWLLISGYDDFAKGFEQLNLNAKIAGWGDWRLISYSPEKRECVFHVYNNWEGAYQKALGVSWGSGLLAGKLAGICGKLFDTNCWAFQTRFSSKGHPYDEFCVSPSSRNVEREIEDLLCSDKATRADMAVAIQKLQTIEQTLRESEQRYDQLVRNIPVGVYVWVFRANGTMGFEYVSSKLCEILGADASEILQNHLAAFNAHPDDRESLLQANERARASLTPFLWDGRFIVHGETRWIRISSNPTLMPDGGSIWNGVVSDITDQMASEQELKALNESLEQRVSERTKDLSAALAALNEKENAKTRFLAAASHDLRQPISAAMLFLESLKLDATTRKQREILGKLDQAMGIFSNQLSRLLDISKFDAGVVRAELVSVELAGLFEWINQSFARAAMEKGLSFRLCQSKRGHPIFVRTDLVLVETVLMNLVTNAVKYTHRGGILVGCRKRGDSVLIQVWDTGIGIESAHLPHIFEEFYQVGNPQRNRDGGLGLGLSIAQRAIRLLGSEIECRSRPGHGSVFEFSLPLGPAIPQGEECSAIVGHSDITSIVFAGKRIFLLEDDEIVAEAMLNILVSYGAAVFHFTNAEEALSSAAISNADYFIVDNWLGSGMSGLEFLNELDRTRHSKVRAVLLTGDTSSSFMARARLYSWPVVHKPVKLQEIATVLNQEG